MAHNLFNEPVGYDRSTLTLLGQAFDEVWQEIAGNYITAEVVEERRMRLALIILELANMGERDLDEIKDDALAIMRLREQQTRLMH
jgi:hypothetical protein